MCGVLRTLNIIRMTGAPSPSRADDRAQDVTASRGVTPSQNIAAEGQTSQRFLLECYIIASKRDVDDGRDSPGSHSIGERLVLRNNREEKRRAMSSVGQNLSFRYSPPRGQKIRRIIIFPSPFRLYIYFVIKICIKYISILVCAMSLLEAATLNPAF